MARIADEADAADGAAGVCDVECTKGCEDAGTDDGDEGSIDMSRETFDGMELAGVGVERGVSSQTSMSDFLTA
jgi:hypothetical protein